MSIDWKCYRYYDNVQIFENQTIMRPLVPKTSLFLGHPALYIYLYQYKYIYGSGRLYPIKVKTAEPIGPKFCNGPHMKLY